MGIPSPEVGLLQPEVGVESAGAQRLRDLRRMVLLNGKVSFGLAIVTIFTLIAIFGPVVFRQDPNAFSTDILSPPSPSHWLGTTQTGQDVFLQVIVGTRVSLILGFVTGLITTIISVIVGMAGAYFGGWIDEALSLFTNIFLVLPALPLAIVLAAFLPYKGPLTIGFVTVITGWSWGARVLRAQTLSMRNREFVEAARTSGESSSRIIFFEILPNEIAIVAVELLTTIVYAILAETGLEYLGLGDVTTVSWGTMFYWSGNNDAILLGAWWWILPPGLCIAILGAGLAFINFGIDEVANPRLRKEAKTSSKTSKSGKNVGTQPTAPDRSEAVRQRS